MFCVLKTRLGVVCIVDVLIRLTCSVFDCFFLVTSKVGFFCFFLHITCKVRS